MDFSEPTHRLAGYTKATSGIQNLSFHIHIHTSGNHKRANIDSVFYTLTFALKVILTSKLVVSFTHHRHSIVSYAKNARKFTL